MSYSTRIAALAIVSLMAGFVVACEDTSQPDVGEAFADITDGTETDTSGTEPSDQEADQAPAKTPEQQAKKDEQFDNRRSELHSSERIEKTPLKGN